ncbi:hypothetical protein AB0L06_32595 [Spirillospora sp. NPDC052269]
MSRHSVRARTIPPQPRSDEGTEHDFACSYEVAIATGDQRTSEQWAREIWEGAAAPLRWFMIIGWRFVLGLRLGPLTSSPEHILGWRIVTNGADEVVCRLGSGSLDADNVFQRLDDTFVWSTFVTYKRRRARVVWPPVSLIHRLLVRISLQRAAEAASRR